MINDSKIKIINLIWYFESFIFKEHTNTILKGGEDWSKAATQKMNKLFISGRVLSRIGYIYRGQPF